jgi:hypothetical protein
MQPGPGLGPVCAAAASRLVLRRGRDAAATDGLALW